MRARPTAGSTERAGRKKGGTNDVALVSPKQARETAGTARWALIGTRCKRAVDVDCTADDSEADVEPDDEDGDGDSETRDEVADAFA